MATDKAKTRMENTFPDLSKTGYRLTSDEDAMYNCIAWAAGEDGRWWEPAIAPGYFWPDTAPLIDTVAALTQVFQGLGYATCDHGGKEKDFDKVVIYADDDAYTHAARQLENGKRTSKVGAWEDIEHNTCSGLEGTAYGKIAHYMKRPAISGGAS